MYVITRAQRLALKRVYDRQPLYLDRAMARDIHVRADDYRETYRSFRRRAFATKDGLMVRWCGMWLGIEKDGYTHS